MKVLTQRNPRVVRRHNIVKMKQYIGKDFLLPRNLKSAPPKMLYVVSCFLFLGCIPARIGQVIMLLPALHKVVSSFPFRPLQ